MIRETRPEPRRHDQSENPLARAVRAARTWLSTGDDRDTIVPKRMADLPEDMPLTRTEECLKTRF